MKDNNFGYVIGMDINFLSSIFQVCNLFAVNINM